MNKPFVILIIVLLIVAVLLTLAYFLCQNQLGSIKNLFSLCQTDKDKLAAEKKAAEERINEKIIIFNKLFVDKVLSAEGAVSYDDRLDLENAAIDTGDEDIISSWHDFLESKTEQEAQQGVLDILAMSADRAIVQ